MADHRFETTFGVTVDSLDLSILTTLSDNAEITASELATKVHLSRPAVARRIKKLQERGLASAPRSAIDFEKLGFAIHAYIHVVSPSKTSFDLLDRLLERPEVLSVNVIIGGGIMLVEVVAKNKTHLHRFLTWLQDFGDSSTHMILREHRSPLKLRDRLRLVAEFLESPDERFD